MPSTTKPGRTPAKKPQTRKPARKPVAKAPDAKVDPNPAPTPPAPPVPPVANGESLFDDQQTMPPAAGAPAVEIARPGEASAPDRPEGIGGEPAVTPPAAQAPVVPEPTAAPAPQAKADDAGEAKEPVGEQSSGGPIEVRLGQASGLLHRLPLGLVLGFADPFAEKIEALQIAATVQALLPRMRASEGRCAPIYFTIDDDGDPEHLFAGDDALAAAKAAGIETVSVVLIHPGDAGAVQAYLNQQAGSDAVSTEDDELVWRAHNEAS
jgi:hypothetical protein